MTTWIPVIVGRLNRVRELRQARDVDPGLRGRVDAVKRYQHSRFVRDYAGLLADPRYADATQFFLDKLYGLGDFAARDAEFERVVPWMAQILPDDVMRTVADLIELHALTEELDQQMAAAGPAPTDFDERSYRAVWRTVGRHGDRRRQLALLLSIGRELDRHTRSKLLTSTLRLMRRPARAAGLGNLQTFLESGMTAFARMGGAREFLGLIASNESRTIEQLFGAN